MAGVSLGVWGGSMPRRGGGGEWGDGGGYLLRYRNEMDVEGQSGKNGIFLHGGRSDNGERGWERHEGKRQRHAYARRTRARGLRRAAVTRGGVPSAQARRGGGARRRGLTLLRGRDGPGAGRPG